MDLVWVMMSRWINFENWFSYERKPRIEDFMNESISSPVSIVESELETYARGTIEWYNTYLFKYTVINHSSSIAKAVVGKWNFWWVYCFVVFKITITSSFLFFSSSTSLLPAWGSIISHLSWYKTLNKNWFTFRLFSESLNSSCNHAFGRRGKRIPCHQPSNKLNSTCVQWSCHLMNWTRAFILSDLWRVFRGSWGSSFQEFEQVMCGRMMR